MSLNALLSGLSPAETAFLAEMSPITIIPRQRLESISLLSGPTPPLVPPYRSDVPLWLALLLKRQGRANITAPAWMTVEALTTILQDENANEGFTPAPPLPDLYTRDGEPILSPPFTRENTYTSANIGDAQIAPRLPYHWLELSTLLLEHAPDDIPESDSLRRILRDLREARAAKIRAGMTEGVVDGGGKAVRINGIGGAEIAEYRGFLTGVVNGLRKIGASKELSRREREMEERETGGAQDDDMDGGYDREDD